MFGRYFLPDDGHVIKIARQAGYELVPIVLDEDHLPAEGVRDLLQHVHLETCYGIGVVWVGKNIRNAPFDVRPKRRILGSGDWAATQGGPRNDRQHENREPGMSHVYFP